MSLSVFYELQYKTILSLFTCSVCDKKVKKNRKKITQGNEIISTAKKRLVLRYSFKIFIIILYRILLISSAVIFQVPHNKRQLHVLRLLINSRVNHELNSSITRVYARFRKCVSNRWVDSSLPIFEKFWNIKKKKKYWNNQK